MFFLVAFRQNVLQFIIAQIKQNGLRDLLKSWQLRLNTLALEKPSTDLSGLGFFSLICLRQELTPMRTLSHSQNVVPLKITYKTLLFNIGDSPNWWASSLFPVGIGDGDETAFGWNLV